MSAQKRTNTLDWENLRFFLELARARTLSDTARRLRVNHSTVARRIARLERDLSITLFDRGPRGYDVTTQAVRLIEHAERMEAEIDTLHRRLSGEQVDLEGVVRITTVDSFATYLLTPELPRFHARYPAIQIELVSSNQELNLGRREADMALRLGRPRDSGLVARKLAEVPYFLYGAKSLARTIETNKLAELVDRPFIGYDNSLFNVAQEDWLDQTIKERRTVFRTNTLEPLLTAARAGLGLAMLPAFVAARDPDLARIPIAETMPPRELWLLVHGDLRRSPRIRTALDFIIDVTERQQRRLAGYAR
jgi:DNA-binding transcriptional LysR family regulator